jgi:hypothetical protein
MHEQMVWIDMYDHNSWNKTSLDYNWNASSTLIYKSTKSKWRLKVQQMLWTDLLCVVLTVNPKLIKW